MGVRGPIFSSPTLTYIKNINTISCFFTHRPCLDEGNHVKSLARQPGRESLKVRFLKNYAIIFFAIPLFSSPSTPLSSVLPIISFHRYCSSEDLFTTSCSWISCRNWIPSCSHLLHFRTLLLLPCGVADLRRNGHLTVAEVGLPSLWSLLVLLPVTSISVPLTPRYKSWKIWIRKCIKNWRRSSNQKR